jgi:transposase
VSAKPAELLEEKRALEHALHEKEQTLHEQERALRERDALLSQHLQRISELERQLETLLVELQGSVRDRKLLEARLRELLAKRRALEASVSKGQLSLGFEEAPLPAPPCTNEAPDGETEVDPIRPRHQRRNAPRKIAYEALPREHVHHELPLAERVCPVTSKELVVVGEKLSEELEYSPARLVVIVHHQQVYGLRAEDQLERKAEPIVAPAPARPIEDARAGAGLLAWILVQKYAHHLPLYRQQAIFGREGLSLPRQTMCDWVMASAYQLGPIQRALKKQILESGVVQLDDTPVKCQGGTGKELFEARLWTYVSPQVDGVVFDFTSDRTHEHVLDFLGEHIAGYLVGDGYAGYATIARKRPGVIQAGCWAHVLRKYRDALKDSPAQASSMMALIGELFDVEVQAIENELDPGGVLALRAERSRPTLDRIHQRAESLRNHGSEQADFGEAQKYLFHQWPTLVRFLEDGRVPIHNNSCERSIRPIAVGRRNWLFTGSERGGEAAATIYSLIESCRRVGVDPYVYLRDVLVRVGSHPASRVAELVPARWKELFGSTLAP